MDIPLVDLRPWFEGDDHDRVKVAAAIDAGLQRLDFLVVVNHGIEREMIDACRDRCRTFFRRPASEKAEVRLRDYAYRGWVPPDAEFNAATLGEDTPPDGKETYAFGPVDLEDRGLRTPAKRWYARNIWPEGDDAFREAGESWWRSARGIADELIAVSELALSVAPGTMTQRCNNTLATAALHWYWPPAERGYTEGQYRIGPHTDFGTLTVLDREVGSGGLEVLDGEGQWIKAPDVPGSLIVNTGDLLRRWTNDRWASNFHRVAAPDPAATSEELISLVFFHGPNHDTVIESLPGCATATNPVRYEPIRAEEYFITKMDELSGRADADEK